MKEKVLNWRKSSYSGGGGGCVELAVSDNLVLMRNSNRLEQGKLEYTPYEIDIFIRGCKAGEFDDLLL